MSLRRKADDLHKIIVSKERSNQRSLCTCYLIRLLGNLLPKSCVARGEEGIFSCIPTQKMWCLHMKAMTLTAGPDFVQQKCAGQFGAAVYIVREAVLFTACRPDKSAKLGLEQQFLPLSRAQIDDHGDGIFG
jgi:hypothetical protein